MTSTLPALAAPAVPRIDPASPMTFPTRLRVGVTAALAGLALLAGAASPMSATAVTRTPPVPTGLLTAIESTARYVPANTCDPAARPGVVQLGGLLTTTYGGSAGISRTCGTDLLATSEHYEGRALDWMHNARVAADKKEADATVKWLLATDGDGNKYANARRLGIMYIIWNNRIWGAYRADEGWRDYNGCAQKTAKSLDSACHRNHVHFSLSWEGAQAATSFWTKTVAAPDFGPCRPADLNWAPRYRHANPVPCPRYPKVEAPAGASATLETLVKYSGMELRKGQTGPIVKTVQKVIGTEATGTMDAKTKTKLKAWQEAHDVKVTGGVNAATWRALLADQSP
jgi:hypothetical protein